MGYHAPSAEAVYRYVCRLDDYNWHLTDGFGFSIIFVNDDSSTCREFLNHYFIDLCHRTADRIRIIFFSDLPESYIADIANRMNSMPRRSPQGMIGKVIDLTSQKGRVGTPSDIFDDFLDALHFQNYRRVDFLLSQISENFGFQYSSDLGEIVHKHRCGNSHESEILAAELVSKMRIQGQEPHKGSLLSRFRNQWKDLNPKSLKRIDKPERTFTLSMHKDIMSSMPGTGESMKFAARLGIGRHVPCFVFFSDVGDPSINVFPVKNLSAVEIYEMLRYWIDSFYEKNKRTIDKWHQVEDKIEEFSTSVDLPISRLRQWIKDSDNLWIELCSIAQIIENLSDTLPKPENYLPTINNLKPSTYNCEKILSECKARLLHLSDEKAKRKVRKKYFDVIITELNDASNFSQVKNIVYSASRERPLPPELADKNGVLYQSLHLMGERALLLNSPTPEKELFRWWGKVQKSLPSLKQFYHARKKWPFIIDKRYNAAKSDYKSLLESIFIIPFSDEIETMLEKTQVALLNIVGVSFYDENQSLLNYTNSQIKPFFHQLREDAPKWIDKTSNDLKISDVIPFRSRETIDFKETFTKMNENHPIHRSVQQINTDWPKHQEEIAAENERIALKIRDEVISVLFNLRQKLVDDKNEFENVVVFSECLDKIRNERKTIENRLIDLAKSSSNPKNTPVVIKSNDVKRFSKLLDEYDNAVNNLIYPYRSDPQVQSVELPASIQEILELKISEIIRPSDRKRNELKEAVGDAQSGPSLFQDVQIRSQTIIPATRLVQELRKLGVILELNNDQDLTAITDIDNLPGILHDLNDYQLNNLWDSLTNCRNKPKSRESTINIILGIAGEIPIREQDFKIDIETRIKGSSQIWPAWMDEVLSNLESKSSLDVGIIIALEEEFRELFPQIKTRDYYNPDNKQYYYLFEWNNAVGEPYRCVVTFMGSMGTTDAAIIADRLIAQFHPSLIVSIGIAGSMDKNVLIGSIVVGEQTDEYLATAKVIAKEEAPGWDIQFSGNPYKSDPTYVKHATNLLFAHQDEFSIWRKLGKESLERWIGFETTNELIEKKLISEFPELHVGHIACGPIVVTANTFVSYLKQKHDRKFLAIEMESVGVLAAAHTRSTSSFIIRGISDYSDERKFEFDEIGKGSLRRYAMNNALRLFWLMMDLQLIKHNN